MTTNVSQPAPTAGATKKTTPLPSAGVATSTHKDSKQESPAAKAPATTSAVIKPDVAPTPVKAEEKLCFHPDKFASVKKVRMYLLEEGVIQYDPANPELVLDTCDKRGKLMPLTPFFKSRIGSTIELVLD